MKKYAALFARCAFLYSSSGEVAVPWVSGATFENVEGIDGNFTGANFEHAPLIGVDLSFATLIHADFTDAHLERVDFTDADLTDATFRLSTIIQALAMDEDIIDEDLIHAIYMHDIQRIDRLEQELAQHMQDFSRMEVSWKIDNPLP